MKKVISLLLVIVFILAFSSVAFANGNRSFKAKAESNAWHHVDLGFAELIIHHQNENLMFCGTTGAMKNGSGKVILAPGRMK